ncbi:PREDICTED: uncharacterized protein LOC104590699 [Nelumbo nucifera]|uniref:Uncharacterized protein LOC104590699 n=1 Tax=Nelumbo nucifera TaxID=4432 RepID=A0A1U7ZJ18_NELNU|nr:PREDICTED: uncharacterized protein LOC104590699 [Nelumbo nucifera]
MYDRNFDLDNHLESFRVLMLLYGYSDTLMYRAFQVTFKGAAHRWFSGLPPCSISSWEQFASLYITHFISKQQSQKIVVSLMSIRQKCGESLRSYTNRLKKEELEVQDLDPMVSMHVSINDLLPGLALKCSVAKKTSVGELQGEANHNRGGSDKKGKNGDGCSININNNKNKDNNKKPLGLTYNQYMPLNSSQTQILMQVGKEEYMKWLEKKRNPKRGNPKKYCKYHRGIDHDIEDCYDLKNEIEFLIHHGHLKEYMGDDAGTSSLQQQQQLARVIDVIIGGLASSGALASTYKAYAR